MTHHPGAPDLPPAPTSEIAARFQPNECRVEGPLKVTDTVMAVHVGTIINPVAHAGQLEGSFIYGVGHAMMEELLVEDGRITNVNLGEYEMPTQCDLAPLRVVYVPTDVGPEALRRQDGRRDAELGRCTGDF